MNVGALAPALGALWLALGAVAPAGCARSGARGERPAELAPGLRLDARAGVVEFDGSVAVDAHDPRTPEVYLEVLVCAPDTREHEALVVTPVRASLIHAALLAAGLEAGAPGRVTQRADGSVERVGARGDAVRVTFHVEQGAEGVDAFAWVEGARAPLVFAGSRLVDRAGRAWYDADGTGVIVGLATFGSEVIAPAWAVSPDSWVDEPAWRARGEEMPSVGTPVTVRVQRAESKN